MKKTTIVIVSIEQQEAFRKDKGYRSHFGYEYNSTYERCECDGGAYATGSYTKIWSAVRDYQDSRQWN